MTTYSQLVDKMVSETRRPDLISNIQTYVNQTIRELHFTPDRGNAIHYRENMRELSLAASMESGYTWDIPHPEVFQGMLAVKYSSMFVDDENPYVPERLPGRILNTLTRYYYRAGNYFVFEGYGGLNGGISLAYYEYPRRLKYFATDCRPCEWDDAYGWSYMDQFVHEHSRATAQSICTNWILQRWEDVLSEGVRAKIYKRISDTERARTCYSLYSQLRQGLVTSEIANPGGAY